MQNQADRDIASPPTPSPGEPYSPGGHLPPGAAEKIPFPLSPQSSPYFSKGTRGFTERDRIRCEEVLSLASAGLDENQEVLAYIIWVMRGLVRSAQVKRLEEWTVQDIVDFASSIETPAVSL